MCMKVNENDVLHAIQSKKIIIPFISFIAICFGLFFALCVWNSDKIKEIDVSSYTKDSSRNYSYYIDELYYEDTNIYLKNNIVKMSGWFTKANEETSDVSIKVVFQNMSTGKYYLMPTLMIAREEVTSFVNDGYNHQYSGFSMNVIYKRLDKDADYKIYILYSFNGAYYLVDMNFTLKTTGEKNG